MAETNSITEVILQTLGVYINNRIRFASVIYGWPSYSDPLSLPAMSLKAAGDVTFQPSPSQPVKVQSPNSTTSKVLYHVGDYIFPLQVDIWTRTKSERHDVYAKLFTVFHGQTDIIQSCLHLDMPEYHAQTVTYHLQDHSYLNDEDAAIRGEWRLMFDVMADCPAIFEDEKVPITTQKPEAVLTTSTGPESF